MSEKSASCGEQSVDRLLAEAGLEEAYEIRDELLELRALANSRPRPSAEVQALMARARVTASPRLAVAPVDDAALLDNAVPAHEAAPVDEAGPTDELAARRRKKGRLTFAAVAVAASLAAGATAAAASEGGIPGTVEHLGAVVGSVVSQLTPGSGGKAPQQQGTRPEPVPMPTHETSVPPSPEPTGADSPSSSAHPVPHATPGSTTGTGSQSDPQKGLHDIAKGQPPVTIPTPVIPTPTLPLPQPIPSEILPGNPVKP